MTAATRPNIIFIICDDLAWGDLAFHGNRVVATPRLDVMFAASTRLTRYCSGPLCTPARAGILTGRWHPRTRAFDTYCGRAAIDPEEPTIARCLGAAGYHTGAFGKWHLGDNYPSRPNDVGFHETLVHRSGGIGQPGDLPANHRRESGSYFNPTLLRNGTQVESNGYCSDVFTNACLEFMSVAVENSSAMVDGPAQQGGSGGAGTSALPARAPFFAYLAFNAPHTPLQIADEWADPYRQAGVNETHARLYGMVANIDHNVGRILDHVDALGIGDRTLVVFTSDHGPCGSSRDARQPVGQGQRFNAGLRGIKGSMYQGGIQVPSLWHWPGTLAPGRDIDRVAATVDVLPTLAEFAGADLSGAWLMSVENGESGGRPSQMEGDGSGAQPPPVESDDAGLAGDPPDRIDGLGRVGSATEATMNFDGISLVPLLRETVTPAQWPTRDVFMQWHRGDAPVRYRNYAVIEQRWKLTRPHEDAADELYDLLADPRERTDLAAIESAQVAVMRQRYEIWFDDVGATRGGRTFDTVTIPLGTVHENPVVLSQNDWRTIGPDGWRDDRIRGYWTVRVEGDGPYTVRLRWREGLPAGTAHVVLDEAAWSMPVAGGVEQTVFERLSLPLGMARLEAWVETAQRCLTARQGHFIPALYVEVALGQ